MHGHMNIKYKTFPPKFIMQPSVGNKYNCV